MWAITFLFPDFNNACCISNASFEGVLQSNFQNTEEILIAASRKQHLRENERKRNVNNKNSYLK